MWCEQPYVPSSLHPLGIGFLAGVAQRVRTFKGPRHSGVLKSSDFQPEIASNVQWLRAGFHGRTCDLSVTHSPVTHSLRTRRTSAFSRQKAAAWCPLVAPRGPSSWHARAGGGLERGRVGKFTSQQQNRFLVFIITTTSVPQEFFDTLCGGCVFQAWGERKGFYTWSLSGSFQMFPREARVPGAYTVGWPQGLSTIARVINHDDKPIAFIMNCSTSCNLAELTCEVFFPHTLLSECLIMLNFGHLITITQKHRLCIK